MPQSKDIADVVVQSKMVHETSNRFITGL